MAYNADQFPPQAVRVITSGSAVTATLSDGVLVINKATGSATAVTLAASPPVGQTLTIKDGKGDAGTNNITVTPATGTIDGQPSFVMKNNYESVTLVFNGTEWNVT